MPFFGGGESLYRLIGSNIIGGNDVLPISVGDFNIGLGNNSLQFLTTGGSNIAVGQYALQNGVDTSENVAIGDEAARYIISGYGNTAIGEGAFYNAGGNGTADIYNNVALGYAALSDLAAVSYIGATGWGNIAVGALSGTSLRSGNSNIFIADWGDHTTTADEVLKGNDNIFIGRYDHKVTTIDNELNNAILIGASVSSAVKLNAMADNMISIGYGAFQTGTTLLTDVINIGANNELNTANSIVIGNGLAATVGNQIIIGDGTHTSIVIGGIDFSGGPTPGSATLTRSKLFSAIFQAGTFTSVGMAAPTHFGGSIGFISGVGYYAAYGFNTSDSVAGAGSNAGFLGAISSGVYSNVEAEYNFLIAFNDNVATSRSFIGINSPNAAIGNVNPSTLLDMVGVGHDSGDTNLSIFHNDGAGAATKTTLGANFPANGMPSNIYNVKIRMDGTGNFIVSVKNITLGIDSGETTISADMPSSATFLTWQVWRNNGADGGVVSLGISQMSFEATI